MDVSLGRRLHFIQIYGKTFIYIQDIFYPYMLKCYRQTLNGNLSVLEIFWWFQECLIQVSCGNSNKRKALAAATNYINYVKVRFTENWKRWNDLLIKMALNIYPNVSIFSFVFCFSCNLFYLRIALMNRSPIL